MFGTKVDTEKAEGDGKSLPIATSQALFVLYRASGAAAENAYDPLGRRTDEISNLPWFIG
jgi:hypothetical protein